MALASERSRVEANRLPAPQSHPAPVAAPGRGSGTPELSFDISRKIMLLSSEKVRLIFVL